MSPLREEPNRADGAAEELLRVAQNLGESAVQIAGATIAPHQLGEFHTAFTEIHRLIRAIQVDKHDNVIAAFAALDLVPHLQRLRALYEYERERNWAHEVMAAVDVASELSAIIDKNHYWALTPDLRDALAGCRHIAFAGSGPLPLTALCIAGELGVEVTCIEVDPDAYEVGRRIVGRSAVADLVTCTLADIRSAENLDHFDAILGAVLLGVDRASKHGAHKTAVVRHLALTAHPTCRLIFREPHGLGVLLYPAVDPTAFGFRTVRRIMPRTHPDEPYRSGLLVADGSRRT